MKGLSIFCIAALLSLNCGSFTVGFTSSKAYRCKTLAQSGIAYSGEPKTVFSSSRFNFAAWDSSSESTGDVNAYPDSRRKVAELKIKVDSNLSKDVMNVAMLKESVRDMEQESSQPGFWDSQEKAQELLTEMNRVKALVGRVEYWKTSCEDVEVLLDMAAEDPDGAGEDLELPLSS